MIDAAAESSRTKRLPLSEALGLPARVAVSRRSRLLGLAGVDRGAAPPALLIPSCRSVHTFGMRFPIDVVFLSGELAELSRRRALPPRRLASDRRASAVLEIPVTAKEAQ